MSVYHRIAAADGLGPGEMVCVEIEGRAVVVCRTEEGFFAVDDACTHAAARLGEGRLRGHRLLCPLHGAAFDVRDGRALTGPATRAVAVHSVRNEGGEVRVALAEGRDSGSVSV